MEEVLEVHKTLVVMQLLEQLILEEAEEVLIMVLNLQRQEVQEL